MKTLYLDIFSGISGDMFLGAAIELGVNPTSLNEKIAGLKLGDVKIRATTKMVSGIKATKVDVVINSDSDHTHHSPKTIHTHEHTHSNGTIHSHKHHHHEEVENHNHHQSPHCHTDENQSTHSHIDTRNFSSIKKLIKESELSDWTKEKAENVFLRIARAEAKIHNCSIDEVHFHEVGAIDSIVDIVGGCIALEMLGKPKVISAPVVEGTGFISCAHGRFPLPAPATLEILSERGVAISQCDEPGEMVTPTGAALIAEFAEDFTLMKSLTPIRVGYGAGSREGKTRPNVLRAILCESSDLKTDYDWETDTVAILETNLDDINSEVLGAFIERALKEGALDVFYTPIQMKKNRPATKLSIVCATGKVDELAALILKETSAFGVRFYEATRRKLIRKSVVVETQFGKVNVKEGWLNNILVQAAPEYEDCKAISDKLNIPLRKVYEAAIIAHSKGQIFKI
ncbi:MAG: nickel pincer cofactor biosynthesis protein LarC [Verrucomicrobiia bacterium]